ncbi:MAG: nucleotide exchange factor GrpE [Clostridiales bacterium]|nr:nucleotide exchange factor GrpE [Clostridiales bacterium]
MAKEDVKETAAQEQNVESAETASDNKTKKEKAPKKPSEKEQLKQQLAEKEDQFLRLAAEYDNFRRRTQKEKEDLYQMSKVTVIGELLPVIDNFERAEQNKDVSLEDYRKGIEMIFKQLNDAVIKLGAEPFGEVGDKFEPNLYSAVMHIEDDSLGEDVVSAVFQKGYKLGDKVIRCATVQVAN